MNIINILTDILNTYTGLPNFVIVKKESKYICTQDSYECKFDDGVVVSLSLFNYDQTNAYLQDVASRIYLMYLKESKEYGFSTK